ncbi:thyroxine 5-deiodinase-like isoform X2 [Penaeus vannamei]|uniref:thyroxine 5-deiodinase-like isoform X2 n=1 Tax=Penaeus vannamei TaxID=6689 RepID=UPI00387F85FE
MSLSTVLRYLIEVPKGLGKIVGFSCILPCLTKALGVERVQQMAESKLDPEMPSKAREKMLSALTTPNEVATLKERSKFIWENALREARIQAELDRIAPDPSVLKLEGRNVCGLLDSASPSRPFVMNFGSCT